MKLCERYFVCNGIEVGGRCFDCRSLETELDRGRKSLLN
jgi:hypothetical protein